MPSPSPPPSPVGGCRGLPTTRPSTPLWRATRGLKLPSLVRRRQRRNWRSVQKRQAYDHPPSPPSRSSLNLHTERLSVYVLPARKFCPGALRIHLCCYLTHLRMQHCFMHKACCALHLYVTILMIRDKNRTQSPPGLKPAPADPEGRTPNPE